MSDPRDRLFELLPVVHRMRDAERGYPLRGLLRVIAQQVEVVEGDIAQLYENWFIETCQDWAVPYIGDLIGYRQVHEAGEPGEAATPQGRLRNAILIPRREVANTIHLRRRRGTLHVLEQLANDVAGWPARAVEFFALLGLSQSLNYQRLARGRTLGLRDEDALDLLNGAFETFAHTADVRRATSTYRPGRHNIPSVGLFIWRLRPYSVTESKAFRLDNRPNCYTFSILGNNTPLYTAPQPEDDPTGIAGTLNVPGPIRRRAFDARKADYYGPHKSLCIYRRPGQKVPIEQIVVADLSGWHYRPRPGFVAVDPELGRIVFPQRESPKNLLVSYHYGFSADIGGGEYDRPLTRNTLGFSLFRSDHFTRARRLLMRLRDDRDQLARDLRMLMSEAFRRALGAYDGAEPPDPALVGLLAAELNRLLQGESLYTPERFPEIEERSRLRDPETLRLLRQEPQGVGLVRLNRLLLEEVYREEIAPAYRMYSVMSAAEPHQRPINDALAQWKNDQPRHAVVEIGDSGVYTEQIAITLDPGQTLELRAADRCRSVIRLLNVQANDYDDLNVVGAPGSRFTLDGLMITGRGVRIIGDPAEAVVRHSTLVPGWEIGRECEPAHETEPSLTLIDSPPLDDPAYDQYYQSGPVANGAVARPITRLVVEHSIVGSILVIRDEVRKEPLEIAISDSILDATQRELEALSGPDCAIAHAALTMARCTVIGEVHTHAIDLAENSIFMGVVRVARSQRGCVRFCYVAPESRTPRRYHCQPDLVVDTVDDGPGSLAAEIERNRVRPQFNSTRYGAPTYCQLASTCAAEIKRGADDESEMGVFHDLFQPQREANLRARLDEFTPAGMDAGMIFVS
jgi:hypothetical protein